MAWQECGNSCKYHYDWADFKSRREICAYIILNLRVATALYWNLTACKNTGTVRLSDSKTWALASCSDTTTTGQFIQHCGSGKETIANALLAPSTADVSDTLYARLACTCTGSLYDTLNRWDICLSKQQHTCVMLLAGCLVTKHV